MLSLVPLSDEDDLLFDLHFALEDFDDGDDNVDPIEGGAISLKVDQ